MIKPTYQIEIEKQIIQLVSERTKYSDLMLTNITKEYWDEVDTYQSIVEDIDGELYVLTFIKGTLY